MKYWPATRLSFSSDRREHESGMGSGGLFGSHRFCKVVSHQSGPPPVCLLGRPAIVLGTGTGHKVLSTSNGYNVLGISTSHMVVWKIVFGPQALLSTVVSKVLKSMDRIIQS